MLAVLIHGGRPNHLDFSPGQGWLEHVRGIDRPFGRSSPHQCVKLVDEEDDTSRLLDLFNDRLEALLELTPVLGSRHHPGQVELDHALSKQGLRDIGRNDPLGQSLYNGRLANPGLPDQYGIVFRSPGEDLDHPLDLCLPTDDRIQLALTRHTGQVESEFVKRGRSTRTRRLGRLLPQQLLCLRLGGWNGHAKVPEDQRGDPFSLTDEPQKKVFCANVVVTHRPRFGDSIFQDLFGLWGEGNFTRRAHLRANGDDLFHLSL